MVEFLQAYNIVEYCLSLLMLQQTHQIYIEKCGINSSECKEGPEEEYLTFASWFPGGSVVKNLPAHVGDAGDAVSIPGSGRSSGEGNGYLLQFSCLGKPVTGEPGGL